MKKKFIIVALIVVLSILIIPFIKNLTEFFYYNYLQRWFANENKVKELNLKYIDSIQSSLGPSDIKNKKGNLSVEQIWGSKDLYKKTGYKERSGWIYGLENVYIVSYGYRIYNATYDLSRYNGLSQGEYTSEFDSEGYWMDYVYNIDEYFEGEIFIYKCDRVMIGNSVYSY